MGRTRRTPSRGARRAGPTAPRDDGVANWEGRDGHAESLAAWAGWSAGGYHRFVVGPFHPEVHRASALRTLAGELRRVERGGGGCVLDAGCGGGNLVGWVGACGFERLRLVGLDADAASVAHAGALATELGVDFRGVCVDLCDRDGVLDAVAGDGVDVVVAINSLLPAAAPGGAPRAPFLDMARTLALAAPAGRMLAVLPGWGRHAARTLGGAGRGGPVHDGLVEAAVAWRLGDNGDGVAHVLHTAATIAEELPRCGWELLECHTMSYPRSLAGAAGTDWVVLAEAGRGLG